MSKYICQICGFEYDEAEGYGDIPPTKWEDLPQDFSCPWCGAAKEDFKKAEEETVVEEVAQNNTVEQLEKMSYKDISVICSNLARGAEKQYNNEVASLYNELASYYAGKSQTIDGDILKLQELVDEDLQNLEKAEKIAKDNADRGALRAIVWNTKVTRMVKSLLNKYKDGNIDADVYVCTICGFIYVGDTLPEVCPVCRVPNWKFSKVEWR